MREQYGGQNERSPQIFKWCRQFYLSYPQIGTAVSHQFELPDAEKSATVSHQFVTDPERLIGNLSFSHIREIMVLKDPFERFFYETECINCNWSVRELRRQIKTNLYVRAGISRKPEVLIEQSSDNANSTALTILLWGEEKTDQIYYIELK